MGILELFAGQKRPTATASSGARIYYLCPDSNTPTGGTKILYRHVDILNRSGFAAFALHRKRGFRYTWFENATHTTYLKKGGRLPHGSVVVIPEVFGPRLDEMFPGHLKVVFNQNAYQTFYNYPLDSEGRSSAYLHPEVGAVLVVSEDSRRYLGYAFHGLRIHRVHNSLPFHLFAPGTPKIRQMCFMPRKNSCDAQQVVNILRQRGALADFRLRIIDRMPEAEVAQVLRESLVFLSFGHPEGCPLPPLEAMACGCVVVGYHGMGGREYFHPEFCRPVEFGRIIDYTKAVESVLQRYHDHPQSVLAEGQRAAEYVRREYSPEREEQDVLEFWRRFSGAAAAHAAPEPGSGSGP